MLNKPDRNRVEKYFAHAYSSFYFLTHGSQNKISSEFALYFQMDFFKYFVYMDFFIGIHSVDGLAKSLYLGQY